MVMPKANVKAGDVYETNGGTTCTVVKYNSNVDVDIIFNDEYKHTMKVALWDLRRGSVKNPYDANVLGVGYLGVGIYKAWEDGKDTKAYIAWINMLRRCYEDKSSGKNVSYIGCTVSEGWHSFQVFAEWYYRQKGWDLGYQLDKDLLHKGNKIYSAENCLLIPKDINQLISHKYRKNNSMPTGVAKRSEKRYRACLNVFGKNKILGTFDTVEQASIAYGLAKEAHVKFVAELRRKELGEIVYKAMMNWTVSM